MATPRVLTMRELPQGLADVVDEVTPGGEVFAGAHRKPEVVIMSVEQYERLTAAQHRAVESAVASLQMESMQPTEVEALPSSRASWVFRNQPVSLAA